MKVPKFPAAIVHLTVDVWNTFKQLRHKAVRGLPVISEASQPKPYDSHSLLKRNVTLAESTEGIINHRANNRVLGELKLFLLGKAKADNQTITSDEGLEMKVDLALARAGLAKITAEGLTPINIRNQKISKDQLEQVQKNLAEIQAEPMKALEDALGSGPLPSSFVVAFIMDNGNDRTSGHYKSDLVLGDWLIAGVTKVSVKEVALEDFQKLKKAAKKIRIGRYEPAPKHYEYLDDLMPYMSNSLNQIALNSYQSTCNSYYKTKTPLVPEVKNLASTVGCELQLQDTFDVMAESIDDRRLMLPGQPNHKPEQKN